MFESLGEKFESLFARLRGQKTLSEDNVREAMREVRVALLEADVNFKVVKDFVATVQEKALGQEVIKGVNPAQQMVSIVHKELVRMLKGAAEDRPFIVQPGKLNVILMLGLQGSGKTTLCGKLAAHMLKENRSKPLLVACDIYRPAAIEQLKSLGKTVGVPVFEMGTATPAVEIVRNGLAYARQHDRDLVIIDTAGRLHIDEVKMDELKAVKDLAKPDYTFLVADSMTGQDAVNSASTFDGQVGIDGVCLTKLDGDSRGGAALSIKAVTGKPIVFAGMGEKVEDLERFHPERVAERILGMGDVVGLVEKAQSAISEEDALDLQGKLATGNFTYNDFLRQMKMIKRMGPLKGLLGMIPGVGSALKDVDNDALTRDLGRVEAIIMSMTKAEREDGNMMRRSGPRRERVAKGSGHSLKQVNDLVNQFEQMKQMMQQLAGGMGGGMLGGMFGGGGMPSPPPGMGLPPGGGMAGSKRQQRAMASQDRGTRGPAFQPKKKKRKR